MPRDPLESPLSLAAQWAALVLAAEVYGDSHTGRYLETSAEECFAAIPLQAPEVETLKAIRDYDVRPWMQYEIEVLVDVGLVGLTSEWVRPFLTPAGRMVLDVLNKRRAA